MNIDYRINRAVLWLKTAEIFNARIDDTKRPDNLTSKAIRKIINNAGNTFFRVRHKQEYPHSKKDENLIKMYQISLGIGYWMQIADRLMNERSLPYLEHEINDDNEIWWNKASELNTIFAKVIAKFGDDFCELGEDDILNCALWAAMHLKPGKYRKFPQVIRDLTPEEVKEHININCVQLIVFGFWLGVIEEQFDIGEPLPFDLD